MKVFVSIKLRCMIGKFDTMLWGLMRRAFTLLLYHVLYYKLQNANMLLLGQLQNYYDVLDMFHIQHAGLTG